MIEVSIVKMKAEYSFADYYNNQVLLSFKDHPFSMDPKHVLTICMYKDRWLLTKHKTRGLEFPGGNVEAGETAREAAIREVFEETGGIVDEIHYVGQYNVDGKRERIIKNVYFARIKELKDQDTYYETLGPVLKKDIPKNISYHRDYSFIMKDGVVFYSMKYIKDHFNL